MLRIPTFLLCLSLTLCAGPSAFAASKPNLVNHPVYATYPFAREGKVADFGTQPMAVPIGVVSAVMQHDQILKKALAERGWEFRIHDFLKGPDINFFVQRGDLDLAVAGDSPTITFAASHDITVVALAKQGFSAIVSKKFSRLEELKGKRISVALNTTAHYGLLVALKNVGLKEADVTLVPIENNEMGEALAQGRVDAFAAWEPILSNTLRMHPEFKVVQRFLNNSYLYFSRDFLKNNPETAELLIAAYIRALRWMRQYDANLIRAVEWNLASSEKLLGKPPELSVQNVAKTTTEDILKIAHSPVVPRQDLSTNGSIRRAFTFLQEQGKIPANVPWEKIAASFDRTLIDKVLANPKKYHLLEYNYEK
ncbi:MAG: NrtA/SsuA/CpmA family ABC transporter substrate-binding protein [Desulfobulbaceae bacterium]|nr:NrtA/SsuA/CpmA family ABC transporter substrate-binding protein [Desulfobulbaceae bacterium]HIJ90644.1 ABC transporter substrate-binding protein [Deltaproteobacteria bacterium]